MAGKVLFTFDDVLLGQYTQVLPALEARSLNATFYVPSSYVGIDGAHLSLAQLGEIYDAGNDVANHTDTHAQLTTTYHTYDEMREHIAGGRDYLAAHGWTRAMHHFAYPAPFAPPIYDDTALEALADEGTLTARLNAGIFPARPYADSALLLRSESYNSSLGVATLLGYIAAAAAYDWTYICLMHDVVAAGAVSSQTNVADLTAALDYAAAQGCEILTITEWWAAVPAVVPIPPAQSAKTVTTRPRPSLLVGSDALGYADLPTADGIRWKHGQHGPADASFKLPCRPFGALEGRLRRDSRLFVSLGPRCAWSGYLLPVSSAQSDGEFVTVEAAGTFERGKHDESYVRTFTDSDESKWFLRKGSSQRLTIETDGTLVLRAEGGGAEQPTNWRAALWAELMYWLDDGLGDPTDVITLLDFLWNTDLTTSWVSYIDAYADPAAVSPISRIWTKNETGSGRVANLACPAGCRALAFGMRVVTKNQLENDVFAELSDVYVTASSGRVRIDEALALVAAELTDGVVTTSPIGDDLEHLVWPLGSGSRSYAQESIASLHDEKTDWRYVPPMLAPGDDSFLARPMPAAPDNRQRWWFVSAKDPGVTVDLTYQDPEGMDIAAVLYSLKGNSRMLVPIPNPETTDWPATWDRSAANATIDDEAYGGWAFSPLGFLLTSDATDYDPRIGFIGANGYGAPVIAGAEYRVTCDVERVTTFWPTGSAETPGITLQVLWYTAAGAYVSASFIDWIPGVMGELGYALISRGDKFTLGSVNGNPVTAPATAAFGKLDVQFTGADSGSGQVAVSNCHLDSLVVPGSKLSVAYHPAAPTSVDQRVRVFDYTSEALTDAAADKVLHQAYDWYGVEESERDREPVGTIGVIGTIQNIDGAPSPVGVIQTGDWITVVDDVEHVTWPQMIVGAEISEDGESASIELGGDGGDFNYTGRAEVPAQQKRKRRRGHHRRVLWKTWAMRNARAAFKKQKKYKTFAAYMKANPLPKKHPKWAPG